MNQGQQAGWGRALAEKNAIPWVSVAWIRVASDFPFDGVRARLDSTEREQAGLFRFVEERNTFAAAHALLRYQLDRLAGGHHAWRFRQLASGKPAVDQGLPQLPFSLSHSRGMAAVAVSSGLPVGVDVEAMVALTGDRGLGELVLAPAERAALAAAIDEGEWRDRFFSFWTLKEAVIKATGQGLAADLPGFAVALVPPRLLTAGPDGSPADHWSLHARAMGAHRLAVAVKTSGSVEPDFRLEEVAPGTLLRSS